VLNVSSGVLTSAHQAWTTPTLDGDTYASPIVADGLVVVATENDTVDAYDATTGQPRWSRHLGTPVNASTLPCGDISPVTGITGTPVADPARDVLYVVAFVAPGHHLLFALDLTSGAVDWSRTIDPPGDSPQTEQQRGALTLANGTIYVPYGGLYGDCGQYHGWIVGQPVSSGTPPQPSESQIAYRVGCQRECALWAPGGPTVGSDGDLWVATGNGSSFSTFDYGNSVLRLSPTLQLLDWFAPSNWARLSEYDLDLGSISPVLLQGGLVWASGKGGTGYLMDQSHLGGIGGEVASGNVCPTFGGTAYQPPSLYLACFYSNQIMAVTIDSSHHSFSPLWTKSIDRPGAPIVAFGALWVIATSTGTVLALDPGSGRQLFSYVGGPAAHFATLAAAPGYVYAVLGNKLTAIQVETAS
jgi:outer membrane protein assembly factor BamB